MQDICQFLREERHIVFTDKHVNSGRRGGLVVEHRTPEREVGQGGAVA